MFFRIARKALTHRRSRVIVAVLALAVGAAVAAAMMSVYYDAGRKISRQLRAYGANVMLAPTAGNEFIRQGTLEQIANDSWPAEVAGTAPFLYIVAGEGSDTDSTRVVVAGTWLDAARKISPWWKLDGSWVEDRNDLSHCIVGANLARQLRLTVGRHLILHYGEGPRSVAAAGAEAAAGHDAGAGPRDLEKSTGSAFDVAGILTTGAGEDDQILVPLGAAQKLSGLDNRLSAIAISAVGDTGQIASLASEMNARLPGARADLVRQIAEGEGRVLGKLRMTMLLVTILMLAAASLSVSTTLASLVMERRKEIGMMKAIGAKDSGLLRLFLFELGALGLAGGIAGYLAGIVLAQAMGRSLFGVGVTPKPEVFVAVIGISLLVALISGIVPIRRIMEVRPAVILKGD
jgi:putative ABC transport system permease protein